MTPFQLSAVCLTAVWLLVVVVRFRHSTAVLAAGLALVGLYTLDGLVRHAVSLATVGLAAAGLAVCLAYSPQASNFSR